MKRKCKDCFREVEIEPNIKLVICGCGGLVYDREEEEINSPKKTTGGAYK